jgi:hypothetical protein
MYLKELLANLGHVGGTFNLGYFDGGTSGPGAGEPIGADHSALPLRHSVRTL